MERGFGTLRGEGVALLFPYGFGGEGGWNEGRESFWHTQTTTQVEAEEFRGATSNTSEAKA